MNIKRNRGTIPNIIVVYFIIRKNLKSIHDAITCTHFLLLLTNRFKRIKLFNIGEVFFQSSKRKQLSRKTDSTSFLR